MGGARRRARGRGVAAVQAGVDVGEGCEGGRAAGGDRDAAGDGEARRGEVKRHGHMSPHVSLMMLIPLAYLVGSVPFGLIVGLAKGVDPRKGGSGNIGATNVARLLGKKFFFLVFTLDMGKSLVPMLIASAVAHGLPEAQRDWRIYL